MRKENATFQTKFISEAGSYLNNADYFAFVELKDYACYVIADGIDSDDRKESAKLAVTTVIAEFSDNPGISSGKMKRYLRAAHETLLQEASEIRLEVSIVVLITDYKKVRWAHAGNSRLYWMRNGMIKASTKDTSLTQRLVDQEELALDQIAYHEERNNLYSYLGQPGRFTPIISQKKLLQDGDILVLQTRGVWENVGEAELIDATDGVSKPEDVCVGLEDVILSQRLRVVENYTIATVFVDKVYNNPKAGRNRRIFKIVLTILVALLMIVLSIVMMRYQKNKSNIAKMEKYKEKGITYLEESNFLSAEEQFDKAFEVSENVNAKPGSKNGKKVSIVEEYDAIAEYVNLAFESLNKANYKDASIKFETAYKKTIGLKDEYQQDVSGFMSVIDAYNRFANSMLEGQNAYTLSDYDSSVSAFSDAILAVAEIGDVDMEELAVESQNSAYAQQMMNAGDDFLNVGMEYYDAKDWLKAEAQFELAKKSYTTAKDDYGSAQAAEKIGTVDNYISSCDSNIDIQGNSDKIKEGSTLEAQGDDYMRTQDYNSALECYQQALECYQEAGSSDYVIAINGKINEAKNGPASDAAFQTFLKAVDYMADAEFGTALQYLYTAKESYLAIDDSSMIEIIDELIVKLQMRTAVG